jgi:hypothetical protein
MKICITCKIDKSFEEFHKKTSSKDGRRNKCKECCSAYSRSHYNKSEERKQGVRDNVRAFKKRTRGWLNQYKTERGCAKCPENAPYCLDFHHLRDKEFNIGSTIRLCWGKQRLLKEIEKCIILCSNCHRKEHNKMRE